MKWYVQVVDERHGPVGRPYVFPSREAAQEAAEILSGEIVPGRQWIHVWGEGP
jgi:hypothetical protein